MYRFAVASIVVVIGLAAVIVISGVTQPDDSVVAQGEADPPATETDRGATELRPGQLEDPGPPPFNTNGWATDFAITAVSFDEIFSGGVPKDGIPAVNEPQFESIEDARGWLVGKSPVIALEIDGDARAYPLAILTWHEIANDVVGDVPVTVTFCPLCHTALVYDRTIDGTVHDFGVSGNLRFSDMVMYDRQTETWWQQATGKGIVGDLTGTKLDFRASQLIGLDQFAETYPDGIVMTRDTGHRRDYGRNPYAGYDTPDQQPFLFAGVTDGRVAPKERVVTLGEQGTEAISFPYTELRKTGVAQVDFEGSPLAVFWTPGATSALGGSRIDESEDVGSTGVFSPIVDGQTLTFVRDGGEDSPITDVETGSTWDITGRAVDGPLAGSMLEQAPHGDHFWFAWAAFVPDTMIWTSDGTISLDGAS
jgi:hypothetical protein